MFATTINFLHGVRARIGRRAKGTSKYAPIWFTLFCCTGLIYGGWRMSKDSIVTEHDVAILRELDNGDFAFVSREQPRGDTFRPCPEDIKAGIDVPGMLHQAVGYVAETARWSERGTCKSLLQPDWEFWFKDEANNFQYRRTN